MFPSVAAEFIRKKRAGEAHSPSDIREWLESYLSGKIKDYQMSAWLMAVYFQGLTASEASALTEAMLNSGDRIDLSSVDGFKVDKHSTGGVGDKTSLILGPIVAACGVPVPMMSGRGLGHTGGTLDKLESIPGFKTVFTDTQMRSLLSANKLFFIGQSERICPADKRLYALRDVTGTVESIPLICASIMSKKIAEGTQGLVLDVKCGSGSFMKTEARATELAKALLAVAHSAGLRASALVTTVDEPLGRWIGNAVEVRECLSILQGQHPKIYRDTEELSLTLAAEMLLIAQPNLSLNTALAKTKEVLDSGKALEIFERVCESQGGRLNELPVHKEELVVSSKLNGYVESFQTEAIGYAAVALGAGRETVEDKIDPAAGIECLVKVGDEVHTGDGLFRIVGSTLSKRNLAKERLANCVVLSESAPHINSILRSRLRDPQILSKE